MLTFEHSIDARVPGFVYWKDRRFEHLGPAPKGKLWSEAYPGWEAEATRICEGLEAKGIEVGFHTYCHYDSWYNRDHIEYFGYLSNWHDFYVTDSQIAFAVNLRAEGGLVVFDFWTWDAVSKSWMVDLCQRTVDDAGPYRVITENFGYQFGAALWGGSEKNPPYSLFMMPYDEIVNAFKKFNLPEQVPWKENN